jgi:ribosome-associated protein
MAARPEIYRPVASGVMPGLRVSQTVQIPDEELEWRFSRSGGPGGQHANTADTRVELRFDVRTSRALGPRQRARLLDRLGPVVRTVVADTRSQARNRELARERLRGVLRAALRVQRARVPTRPGPAARQARLRGKRERSERKRLRRPPQADD